MLIDITMDNQQEIILRSSETIRDKYINIYILRYSPVNIEIYYVKLLNY
jgi:hypothetical protein